MSSLIYPGSTDLPGLKINRARSYLWKTTIHPRVSGKETRIRLRQFPQVRFTLNYEVLRDNLATSELKRLVGLYNALAGNHDTCLYVDPDFSSVTAENFGTGNGTTAAFQLTAKFQNSGGPGVAEAIQNLNGAPSIFVNGVLRTLTTHYTIGPTGIITFVTPPPNTHPVTWTGSFHYRVRFEDEELEAEQFLTRWWQMREVRLLSVRL